MKYTYYQGGGGGGSGGFAGTQVKQAQYSKDEAEMFSFLFQACVCLYNAVRNAPAEKKAELYQYFVINTIRFVNTFASSCGTTPEGLFQTKESYNMYLELLNIQQNGRYGDIPHVEHTCDNLFANLGAVVGTTLQSVGFTVSQIANSLTGILGCLGGEGIGSLLGGIVQAAGGVVNGLTQAVSGILG
ncbi:hypothetical protein GJQ63_26045, partial [Escherichia coli]|uniref:hypothetical protein n=1 Tax=Escherichia coli TaxID=562 RepID=UPI00159378C4